MKQTKGGMIKIIFAVFQEEPDVRKMMDGILQRVLGMQSSEIIDDEWYDFVGIQQIFGHLEKTQLEAVGRKVLPTLKRLGFILPGIHRVAEMVKFDTQLFALNNRGMIPRELLREEDHRIQIQNHDDSYGVEFTRGIYLGILDMCKQSQGSVSVLSGGIFDITW